jgi:putative membrane protein
MKKRSINLLLVGILSAALFSCGNPKDSNNTAEEDPKEVAEEQNEEKTEDTNMEKDADFAVNAADGGLMEVQLGEYAAANASSAEVKKFAQMMVSDHSKANDELKALAQQKNISIPAALSDNRQKKLDNLKEKKGTEFDKAYIDMMVEDHEDDVDLFEKEAENGKDAEIKSWAAGKVTALRHHLDMAKATQDIVKNQKNK